MNPIKQSTSKITSRATTQTEALIDQALDAVIRYGTNKATQFIKSHFGYEICLDKDNDDTEYWNAQDLLCKINPTQFHNHAYRDASYRSEAYTLRQYTSYTIRLNPQKLNAFIHVSTKTNSENYEYKLHIFFFGKDAHRACRMFVNSLNPQKEITVTDMVSMVDVYSLDLDKDKDVYLSHVGKVQAKTFKQIFTDEASKTHVESYLSKWYNASKLFASYGISHKAGILLYGPPGTGKSSMAKAIGAAFGFPVYSINMSSFSAKMIPFLQSKSRSSNKPILVLMEDIDYIFGKRTQDRTPEEKANGNAILQLLDGVNSISNIIFVATTNDIESLDDAIKREGRFDLKILMDNISASEATEMIRSMYITNPKDIEAILADETFPINPAHLQNKIVHYVFDHLEILQELPANAPKYYLIAS